jgi:hypothetical protein
MKDRKGNVVEVIYRSRKAMTPPLENPNRSQENARRLRQIKRQAAKQEAVSKKVQV